MDDLENVVTPDGLQGGYEVVKNAILILENDHVYKTKVLCEPQLGKRGLYPELSTKDTARVVGAMMDVITYSDGYHSLIDIAEKTRYNFFELAKHANILEKNGLIAKE